jgi:hypothetical protein
LEDDVALPRVKTEVKDGALGLVSPGGENVPVLVGAATAGTLNVLQSFGDLQAVKDTLTSGPLAEAAAFVLNAAGGTVYVVRVPSSVAGAAGAVTKTEATGKDSEGTLAVAGAALDAYSVRVEVMADGASLAGGLATFRYALDYSSVDPSSATYSPTYPVPTAGTFVVPGTGLTLTFADGVDAEVPFLNTGDAFTFTTTAPYYSSSEAMAGVDAALADPSNFFKVHLVGQPSTVSAAVTLATSLAAKLDAAALAYRFLYGTVEVPQDTDSNIKTGTTAFASARVELAAGFADYVSALDRGGMKSVGFKASSALYSTARAALVPVAEHLGQVSRGPMSGVLRLYRDERVTPGLDEARLTTLCTHVGRPGFFITRGRLAYSPGSDFQRVEYRRVMDVAARRLSLDAQFYLNSSVQVDSAGRILEEDARSIESTLASGLRLELEQPGQVSAVSVQVIRTDNIVSTGTLRVKARVRPLGYAEFINVELGFETPSVQEAA